MNEKREEEERRKKKKRREKGGHGRKLVTLFIDLGFATAAFLYRAYYLSLQRQNSDLSLE
jgi:hypothetical protein